MYYVYVLLSGSDGGFYTGSTGDLKHRFGERHEDAGHWSWFIMKRAIVVRMVAGVRNILRRARVNGIFGIA
jgi:predicted GIY-YIG superfamily endonuclease